MFVSIQNKWLADLLRKNRDRLVQYWMEHVREAGLKNYEMFTERQLFEELAPTVDSMIQSLATGDDSGPRQHSLNVVRRRLREGFMTTDLLSALYALRNAVMRIVYEADVDLERQSKALDSTSNIYYRVGSIVAEVYDELRKEQNHRIRAGCELSNILSKTLDLSAVLDSAVREVAQITHASSVAILLLDRDENTCTVRASYMMDTEIEEIAAPVCHALGYIPGGIATQPPEAYVLTVSDILKEEKLRQWRPILESKGYRSLACFALISANQILGTIIILHSEVMDFMKDEVELLVSLSGHTAAAVKNAWLFEEAKGKREITLLLEANRLFSSSLDIEAVLGEVASITTKYIGGNFSAVFFPDEEGINLHIHAYYSTSAEIRNKFLNAAEPKGIRYDEGVVGQVFSTGIPRLVNDYSRYPHRIPGFAEFVQSFVVAPIRWKGKILGVFGVASSERDHFNEADLSLVTAIADQAGGVIENTRLYRHEKRIAETLQRSLMPRNIPPVHGFDFGVTYRAALEEAELGGDYYDVYHADREVVSIVVADVAGKGLKAAVHTAMSKYTARAYAAEDTSPGSILLRFNKAFSKYMIFGNFVTIFYAALNPTEGTLTYCAAGHERPILFRDADSCLTFLEVTGPAIGVVENPEFQENTVIMQPGDTLMVYTDGATDVKRNGKRLGIEGLVQVFRENVTLPVSEAIKNIDEYILNFGSGKLTDDVVLLMLRRLK